MSEPLAWILATGAVAPLGLSSMQVAMGVRARKGEPRASRLVDRRGQRIGYARVAGIHDDVTGFARLAALAAPALAQAWPRGCAEPLPLLLALPEAGRADDDWRIGLPLIATIASRSGARIDARRSEVYRAGHAGSILALEAAIARLSEPDPPPAVLVGGVDSYAHPGVLAELDRQLRLHAPGVGDGFIPSEAAAFLLVAANRAPLGGRTCRPLAAVRDVAVERESSGSNDAPRTARAMTNAVRRACDGRDIGWVLTDVNGESQRVREWMMVETRVFAGAKVTAQRPAIELGDIGAASGATFAAIACASWLAGCAPAARGIIAVHSDGPERGACLLERAS